MEWQRILHERGWAAPAWPVEYGGCDWSLTQHYIFSRESTPGRSAVVVADGHPDGRPRDHQVRHGRAEGVLPAADPDRRGVLLPGLLRTRGGLGPGGAVDGGGRRRRRLGVHRQQDLDDARRRSELDVRSGAHVADREEAAGHHVRADRHGVAGHSDPPAGDDVGRGDPEPGVLRRGAGAEVQRARPDRRRLDRREVSAGVRTRRWRSLAGAAGDGRRDRHRGRRPARHRAAAGCSTTRRSRASSPTPASAPKCWRSSSTGCWPRWQAAGIQVRRRRCSRCWRPS